MPAIAAVTDNNTSDSRCSNMLHTRTCAEDHVQAASMLCFDGRCQILSLTLPVAEAVQLDAVAHRALCRCKAEDGVALAQRALL